VLVVLALVPGTARPRARAPSCHPVWSALAADAISPILSLAQVESAMGPALQAAFLVMNHIGGKLLLFQVRRG